MQVLKIIEKYYKQDSLSYHVLVTHSKLVTEKALSVASNLRNKTIDILFIEEAAMLHDIGIMFTHAPDIGCYGELPYICHGYLGKELLEKEGFCKHALVCERHTGTGISQQEILEGSLPLPQRDMIPLTLEEKIICYADKFYSKDIQYLEQEKDVALIVKQLGKFNVEKGNTFLKWHQEFAKE